MKRKVLVGLFVLVLMFSMAGTATAAMTPTIVIDGKVLYSDVPPVIEKGRVLVPLRPIFDALDGEIHWWAEEKRVAGFRGAHYIDLVIGSKTAFIAGRKEITLDVPAKTIKGRTFVPLRAISETLGAEVKWDPIKYVAQITTPKTSPIQDIANASTPMVVLVTTDRGVVGSGFAWGDVHGEIITNAHVVEGARWVTVKTYDQKVYPATVVMEDSVLDIARILVNNPSYLDYSFFYWHMLLEGVSVGDQVIAIGNSLGLLENTVSTGIISGKRDFGGTILYQTTAPISQGNSGGPLLDDKGRVIGINTATMTDGQNLNFAIPIDYYFKMQHRPKEVRTQVLPDGEFEKYLYSKFGSFKLGNQTISAAYVFKLDNSKTFGFILTGTNYSNFLQSLIDGYKPEVDRWLEDIAKTVIENYPPDENIRVNVIFNGKFSKYPTAWPKANIEYIDGMWDVVNLEASLLVSNGRYEIVWY
ncbi:MAG: stalk domain-containing protein [Thermincolia bacterium]